MTKEFTEQTVAAIRGGVDIGYRLVAERQALHVDFSSDGNIVPAECIDDESVHDPSVFNAIGSLAFSGDGAARGHLPVVDVDGGVDIQSTPRKQKAILGAKHKGFHKPKSMLRDVLGDYGIDLEVFPEVKDGYSRYTGRYYQQVVSALVLRSARDIFEHVESTTRGNHHLYIQELFSEADHAVLIEELCATGIVSERWRKLVEQETMGVVRTPWTKKDYSRMNAS